jgi:hypothetical protein
MYTVYLAHDLIVSANNLGENKTFENKSLREVNDIFDEFNELFGSPQSVSGMFIWQPSLRETILVSVRDGSGSYVDCDTLVVNVNLVSQL